MEPRRRRPEQPNDPRPHVFAPIAGSDQCGRCLYTFKAGYHGTPEPATRCECSFHECPNPGPYTPLWLPIGVPLEQAHSIGTRDLCDACHAGRDHALIARTR